MHDVHSLKQLYFCNKNLKNPKWNLVSKHPDTRQQNEMGLWKKLKSGNFAFKPPAGRTNEIVLFRTAEKVKKIPRNAFATSAPKHFVCSCKDQLRGLVSTCVRYSWNFFRATVCQKMEKWEKKLKKCVNLQTFSRVQLATRK